MLYIVGTKVTTKVKFDPRQPDKSRNRPVTWLPKDIDWVLGRISKTPDAESIDYMFYCEQNPSRTHTTTFPSCETADQAIASARGEKIVDETVDTRTVNLDEKFKQVGSQLTAKERGNTMRSRFPRR